MPDGSNLPVPAWEHLFPGRFRYELDALAQAGAVVVVDPGALSQGVLALDIDWPYRGSRLALRAVFPGTYPFFRPLVLLVERPFPSRHVRPNDGLICLLGRNTRQWQANLTLAQLLLEQLEMALEGTPDEDPQGEPAEMWWNSYGRAGSYALVDSGWSLGEAKAGRLRIAYRTIPSPGSEPLIQAAVLSIEDEHGQTVTDFGSLLPPSLTRRATIPWVRMEQTPLPSQVEENVTELLTLSGLGRRLQAIDLGGGWAAQIGALVYPSELQQHVMGDGWLFLASVGRVEAFRKQKGGRGKTPKAKLEILRTQRAGEQDMGFRIPAVTHLRTKTVGVVGLGAIGSPIVVSLARNRALEVRMLEYDDVEPGTTVRWARGATAWGLPKLTAMAELLGADYPATRVTLHEHIVGHEVAEGGADLETLRSFVGGCDIVVDAAASYGVTVLLAHLCRKAGLPLVSAYATPQVEGGVVMVFRPDGGCPTCLEWARHDGSVPPAPGPAEGTLAQPPGCSEPTFMGADFDLQEISLQVMRAVTSELEHGGREDSDVFTLAFETSGASCALPAWRRDILGPHSGCSCWIP